MKSLHDKHYPNESPDYRAARNKLLDAEIALRKQTEEVARQRRHLPVGGKLKDDYIFTEKGKNTKFSELFQNGMNTLVMYNMMYDFAWEKPCPMCNSIVDGLNGNARQITQRVNLVVVGKAPIEKLLAYADKNNWDHIRIISSSDNSYNADYFGEESGGQTPMMNVFVRKEDGIYHTWGSELRFVSAESGQNERLVDSIWPLWNVLDLTPEGRGEDWYPKN